MTRFHLALGTPCYGGMMTTEFAQSILGLQNGLHQHGHQLTAIFLGNESLIQRGRNKIAHYFLKTTASHLLFCDADIRFDPNDIAKMIQADKDIIIAPVPMKQINWERVRKGAMSEHQNLASLSGYFALSHLDGHQMISPDMPFEIKYGGTGLMLIKRHVFERLQPTVGSYIDHTDVNQPTRMGDFFQVCKHEDVLLSEDYFFCLKAREAGMKVWAAPWCTIAHFGAYAFSGSYADSFAQKLDVN